MKPSITKDQFLSFNLSNISQVYSGKRECCRCGCGGDYIATSYMENPRSEVNDFLVQKRLSRAQRLILEGTEFNSGDNYFDVKTGKDRTLTFYIDELKSNNPTLTEDRGDAQRHFINSLS